ncbi:MAG: cupin domain-containing protein [Pseudomonadota bacterium]
MAKRKFSVSHLKDSGFRADGLRAFFEYRDLGVKAATGGGALAHVIRARPGGAFVGKTHWHDTEFQLVYVLKGWIKFDYEGVGEVLLEAGSCAYQPPGIRHRELGHSDDIEILEVVMPGNFKTVELPDH